MCVIFSNDRNAEVPRHGHGTQQHFHTLRRFFLRHTKCSIQKEALLNYFLSILFTQGILLVSRTHLQVQPRVLVWWALRSTMDYGPMMDGKTTLVYDWISGFF